MNFNFNFCKFYFVIYRSLVDNSNLFTEQINLYKYERLLLLLLLFVIASHYSERSRSAHDVGSDWVSW